MILQDKLNRPLHDLRISVIDRCNFRCPYCMPKEQYPQQYKFLQKSDWLTFGEIIRLVRIFTHLGVNKIRLTGGEPLLRPDLPNLLKQLHALDGISDSALTTNGSLLKKYAKDLKSAGLKRLTVSLDTLDSRIFKHMSGRHGSVKTVLDAIDAGAQAGFESIKINVVVQKGVNDHTIIDLVEHFRGTPHVLRFIEYMDVGTCNHWNFKYVFSSKEILNLISRDYPLEPVGSKYYGEVAKRYRYLDGKGEIGFISSVTQPFCRRCTRARLSTDGKLFTCLFATSGVDLRTPLREGASDSELLNIIQDIWQKRDDQYSELRSTAPNPSNKIEMFQIGG